MRLYLIFVRTNNIIGNQSQDMKYFIKLFIACMVTELAFASSVIAQCDAQAFVSTLERLSKKDAKKMASEYFIDHAKDAYKDEKNNCLSVAGDLIVSDISDSIPDGICYALPARFSDAIDTQDLDFIFVIFYARLYQTRQTCVMDEKSWIETMSYVTDFYANHVDSIKKHLNLPVNDRFCRYMDRCLNAKKEGTFDSFIGGEYGKINKKAYVKMAFDRDSVIYTCTKNPKAKISLEVEITDDDLKRNDTEFRQKMIQLVGYRYCCRFLGRRYEKRVDEIPSLWSRIYFSKVEERLKEEQEIRMKRKKEEKKSVEVFGISKIRGLIQGFSKEENQRYRDRLDEYVLAYDLPVLSLEDYYDCIEIFISKERMRSNVESSEPSDSLKKLMEMSQNGTLKEEFYRMDEMKVSR